MAIRFTCPCGLTLEAEQQYAGQLTICPQCNRQKKIPNPVKPPVAKLVPPPVTPAPASDVGFEVIEDAEPIVAAPRQRPRPSLTMRGDDDGPPVRRKKAAAAVNDDRPRKRTPKKKTAAQKSQMAMRLWKILGGVGFLILGLGLLAAWWFLDVRRGGKLLIWGIVAAVIGVGGIGTALFGTVDADAGSDYDSDDDDDDD